MTIFFNILVGAKLEGDSCFGLEPRHATVLTMFFLFFINYLCSIITDVNNGVICFSVFRFIRTFYLVLYNLLQAGLFVYITSVLLSRLIFQGAGTEKNISTQNCLFTV